MVIYPFFFMVTNSFKPGREIIHSPAALPTEITLVDIAGCSKT